MEQGCAHMRVCLCVYVCFLIAIIDVMFAPHYAFVVFLLVRSPLLHCFRAISLPSAAWALSLSPMGTHIHTFLKLFYIIFAVDAFPTPTPTPTPTLSLSLSLSLLLTHTLFALFVRLRLLLSKFCAHGGVYRIFRHVHV